MQKTVLLVLCLVFVNYTTALYIKTIEDDEDEKAQRTISTKMGNHQVDLNEWSSLQRKLGLSDQKVEVLKSQKDQKATMELLNRFMKENPKYVTISADNHKQNMEKKKPNHFLDTYHAIVEQLRKAEGTLKTSLNFELADKTAHEDKKRSRRKIAVRMVSDMPTEKIDELLAMFNEQHGLREHDENDDVETDEEYNEVESLPSTLNPDYEYEHLYEDEEGDAAPPRNPFGSFQDLIVQATRRERQRELEETKLHANSNKHFF